MQHTSSGTYAKLVPDDSTKERIFEIVDLLNIPNYVSKDAMHLTVVYSRVVCPSISNVAIEFPILASGTRFEIFSTAEGSKCLVLVLVGNELHKLHNECVSAHGATHDFATFCPHITLSYDYPFDDMPNPSLMSYFKNLAFTKFVVEPLVFNWIEP